MKVSLGRLLTQTSEVVILPKNESPFSNALKGTMDNIRSRKKAAGSAQQLSFDKEKLAKPQQLSGRWETMSEVERSNYIKTNGLETTMTQLKGVQE